MLSRVVDEVLEGLGVLDLFELLHPLFVLDAGLLQLRELVALQAVDLLPQDEVGILEDGLDERDDVQGVRLALGLQRRQGVVQP